MEVFRETFDDVNDINVFLEKNPQYKCINIETITNGFGVTHYFAVWLTKEERKETIDEEKLDKLARNTYKYKLEYPNEYGSISAHDLVEAFKVGYRKAKEE